MSRTCIRRITRRSGIGGLFSIAVLLAACGGDDGADPALGGGGADSQLSCNVNTSQIFDGGVGRDGIPALSDPEFVGPDDPDASYLLPDDRVLGFVVAGQAYAVPHNILWWHEIANLNLGGRQLAITYCPLTGSTLAFDRSAVGGAELGVSGLLFNNNLIMFSRDDGVSLFPQMLAQGACGPRMGRTLSQFPIIEMEWQGWLELHPDTRVVSGRTGFSRNYELYPYGNYEDLSNTRFLFPMPRIDQQRPPKERILGLREGKGGKAFPFGILEEQGTHAAVATTFQGSPAVVFWSTAKRAAAAYRNTAAGQTLTFEGRPGGIFDRETGSRWTVTGVAVAGPLEGERLQQIPEGYVAFWGAWAIFQPDTEMWTG